MSQIKISTEELTELSKLIHRADNATFRAEKKLKELGTKYGYDYLRAEIDSETGTVSLKGVKKE